MINAKNINMQKYKDVYICVYETEIIKKTYNYRNISENSVGLT